jgi:hypothetical protein
MENRRAMPIGFLANPTTQEASSFTLLSGLPDTHLMVLGMISLIQVVETSATFLVLLKLCRNLNPSL